MYEIDITVTDKIAQAQGSPVIVCGNSDYVLRFTLDSEWDDIENITAQIAYLRDGDPVCKNVLIEDGQCALPVIYGACGVVVGIVGVVSEEPDADIHTSSPAFIPCELCISDMPGSVTQPPADIYNQLMEVLSNARD